MSHAQETYDAWPGSAGEQQVALLERPGQAECSARGVSRLQRHSPAEETWIGHEPAALPTSPVAGVRLVPLVTILIVVTLGMILSLLDLSSTRGPVQAPSMEALFTGLPPLHILLIGGLIVLSGYALVARVDRPLPPPAVEKGEQTFPTLPPHPAGQQALQDAHSQAHLELLLMRIWAKVLTLPIEHMRGTSDFFLCGGDTDSLIALLGEIERQFCISLDPSDVFAHPVLYGLAAVLIKKQHEAMGMSGKRLARDDAFRYE